MCRSSTIQKGALQQDWMFLFKSWIHLVTPEGHNGSDIIISHVRDGIRLLPETLFILINGTSLQTAQPSQFPLCSVHNLKYSPTSCESAPHRDASVHYQTGSGRWFAARSITGKTRSSATSSPVSFFTADWPLTRRSPNLRRRLVHFNTGKLPDAAGH